MIPPPLALYLHIPFCTRKCPYCDFYSRAGITPEKETAYIDALLRELFHWRQHLQTDPRPLGSVFFGGGTPSLLSVASITRILNTIRTLWPLAPEAEITLEANPDSATQQRLEGYRAAGVNRLSLGVQAFDHKRLHLLGRIHSVEAARQALRAARAAGFDNLGLDLIYATPGHTLAAWQEELAEAMSWNPEHISCYTLTLEPDTPFARQHAQTLPEEEIALELFQATRGILAEQGWPPYEISNFAKPGRHCRHNSNYWTFGDYLGVGAAAHGKLTRLDTPTPQVYRTGNPADIAAYVNALRPGSPSPIRETFQTRDETAADALIMGLRQEIGLERPLYQWIKGIDIVTEKSRQLDPLRAAGWIDHTPERLFLTPRGVVLADTILASLL
ncbi:MAG: radical SAM family heme chaperone HemW [Magnetococcales bacterium]|nr:radical SAM family heme chaperone HemW [Magnetococcales bacterium]